jgi:BirA family transcriptional regulator, biotin operon repressor / biotin---[acetyl-CoA-carboxylase] ligase
MYNPAMDLNSLQAALAHLSLPEIRYEVRVGSTNDLAARWAEAGAPDLALIVADEQTSGRGRMGRLWHTPGGAALAFSLVLRPALRAPATHLTGLGALAVCTTLVDEYGLQAQIKWPNDVLVNDRKLCGVLVEAAWQGEQMSYAVLGIGVNVAARAVPDKTSELIFPATAVETELGREVRREALLAHILAKLLVWRGRLGRVDFIEAWKLHLAWVGSTVEVDLGRTQITGRLAGLSASGGLLLELPEGRLEEFEAGDVRLRTKPG